MKDRAPSSSKRAEGPAAALRRGLACLSCRKRKLKCDSVRPVCSNCTARKRESECEYDDTKKKSRVQTLKEKKELLQSQVQKLLQALELQQPALNLTSGGAILGFGSMPSISGASSSTSSGSPHSSVIDLGRSQFSSSAPTPPLPLPSGGAWPRSTATGASSGIIGPFNHVQPPVYGPGAPQGAHLFPYPSHAYPAAPSFSHQPGPQSPPNEVLGKLIESFLSHQRQCCFSDPQGRFSSNPGGARYPSLQPGIGSQNAWTPPDAHPALLSAVYLLGCHFLLVSDSSTTDSLQPFGLVYPISLPPPPATNYAQLKDTLLQKARKEIISAAGKPSPPVDVVQACCLFAQYYYFNGDRIQGYRHAFAAARLAMRMGLHQTSLPNKVNFMGSSNAIAGTSAFGNLGGTSAAGASTSAFEDLGAYLETYFPQTSAPVDQSVLGAADLMMPTVEVNAMGAYTPMVDYQAHALQQDVDMEKANAIAVFWQIFTVDRMWSAAHGLVAAMPDENSVEGRVLTPFLVKGEDGGCRWAAYDEYIGGQSPASFLDFMTVASGPLLPMPTWSMFKAMAVALFDRASRIHREQPIKFAFILRLPTDKGTASLGPIDKIDLTNLQAVDKMLQRLVSILPKFEGTVPAWGFSSAPFDDVMDAFAAHTILHASAVQFYGNPGVGQVGLGGGGGVYGPYAEARAVKGMVDLIDRLQETDYAFLDASVVVCWNKVGRILLRRVKDQKASGGIIGSGNSQVVYVGDLRVQDVVGRLKDALQKAGAHLPFAAELGRTMSAEFDRQFGYEYAASAPHAMPAPIPAAIPAPLVSFDPFAYPW
ncbi:hypothetical protein DFP72DRAFT_887608 [Ephemerocybe angulata]|uniref:Zn(2)-C6 fungal-type domain-containing protein n=1 Tax=Ephemerocybe angulata TaxID=980116 RepID=A0A8H6MB16_9AGAR|nr:hypothetical protein DFP72DRAFT_887608 [Tulosesus angulatus]